MATLAWVVKQLREERKRVHKELVRLDEAISAIGRLAGGASVTGGRKARARRKLSAAARRRISQAQKARWAKLRQEKKGA